MCKDGDTRSGQRVLAEKKVRMADTSASFAAIKEIDNQRGIFEEVTRAVNKYRQSGVA